MGVGRLKGSSIDQSMIKNVFLIADRLMNITSVGNCFAR